MWQILACPICGLECPYECEHIQSGRSEYRIVEVVPAEVLKTVVAVNEIERDRYRDAVTLIDDLTHQDVSDPRRLISDVHRITRKAISGV